MEKQKEMLSGIAIRTIILVIFIGAVAARLWGMNIVTDPAGRDILYTASDLVLAVLFVFILIKPKLLFIKSEYVEARMGKGRKKSKKREDFHDGRLIIWRIIIPFAILTCIAEIIKIWFY